MLLSDVKLPYNWTLAELNAFCLVCESRNLSQVATRLDMTQSGLSQMVQRWRQVVGDPLFVRSRYGVVPTEVAASLYQKILPNLVGLKTALVEPEGFNPSRTARLFKIHLSDTGQYMFLPALHSYLSTHAPQVHLLVRTLKWEDVEKGMGAGEVDVAIGSLPMIKGRVHAKTLRKYQYVTLMRKGHHLSRKKFDLSAFAAAEHMVIDASSSGHLLVESVLRTKGVFRTIGLTLPHHTAVERILLTSDYLLTIPEGGLCVIRDPDSFHILPTPIPLPTFDIRLHWHERSSQDEGVKWLRNVITDLFLDR